MNSKCHVIPNGISRVGTRTSGAKTMNTAQSSNVTADVPAYTELQREMHEALRAQHPEWIQPDGDCPTCRSYEVRLAELLSAL